MHRQTSECASVSYAAILRQREFWGAALGHFCINYAFYFVMTWLPTFLVKAGGFTVSQMAGIGAAIYGIYAVTTALAGVASDRWIRRGGAVTRVRKTFAAGECPWRGGHDRGQCTGGAARTRCGCSARQACSSASQRRRCSP